VTEVRRLLGVLRFKDSDGDEERMPLTPAPSLSRLPELTETVRAAASG